MNNRLLAEMPLPRDGNEPKSDAATARKSAGGRKGPARTVTVNRAESPLGWLKSRGLVSARQYDAGEKLRTDWERAKYAPNVTTRWDAPTLDKNARGPADAETLSVAQLGARRRFEAAAKAVGSGLGEVLWRVVCAGENMRDAERALGWPTRAGRVVLCLALDRLADHYRLR